MVVGNVGQGGEVAEKYARTDDRDKSCSEALFSPQADRKKRTKNLAAFTNKKRRIICDSKARQKIKGTGCRKSPA